MLTHTITLLILGLGCLAGAAVLNATSPSPVPEAVQSLELPTPEPTASLRPSALPTRLAASLSPAAAASASPSGSASASPSGSASPSPSGSASPAASATASPRPSASSAARLPVVSPSANAAELHRQAVVVDTHVETPWLISERNIKLRTNTGQVSLDKLRQGGVDVVFFSIYVNPAKYANKAKSQAEFIIAGLKKEIQANADLIELATSYDDIVRIVASGKIAGLMGMEGGDPIGESLANVDHFYKLGVRYLGPTWSTHTLLGDSSGPPKPRWNGLTKLGKEVVGRMNQLGMLVDVSHLSDAAFYDVLKTSRQPVIASHSGVDGVRVHPRNLSNDMLKLLAVNGGVVGVLFYPPFLEPQGTPANVASVVKHIDYARKTAGLAHVGLGSDFDGLDLAPPQGLQDATRFPAITEALKQKGYKNDEIAAVLGGNFMRVFQQVLK
ncbi:MAG: dipeptidase [Candidatus Sericytochromatia bacterium]